MKKIGILGLSFIILMSLAACGSKAPKDYGEAYNSEMDYPFINESGSDGTYVAETEAGYYFLNGHFIYYADKGVMKPVPLCNKPDCKHDNETDDTKVYNCNAYLSWFSPMAFLQYYKGALYAVEDFDATEKVFKNSLVRISLDGSKRERIMDASDQCVYAIHRDYLYIAQNGNEPKVVRVPMDKLNAEPEVMFESQLSSAVFYIFLKGNTLLIQVWGNNEEDQTYHSQFFVCNILTGKTKQIGEKEEQEGLYVECSRSTGDNRLIYYMTPEEKRDTNDNIAYTCDMDGENTQVLKDFRNVTDRYIVRLSFDGTYYYEDWINYMEKDLSSRKITVYDKDYNILCEKDSDWLPKFYSIAFGYGQYMFFKYTDADTKESVVDYVDKSMFEKGIFEPHRLFDCELMPGIGI